MNTRLKSFEELFEDAKMAEADIYNINAFKKFIEKGYKLEIDFCKENGFEFTQAKIMKHIWEECKEFLTPVYQNYIVRTEDEIGNVVSRFIDDIETKKLDHKSIWHHYHLPTYGRYTLSEAFKHSKWHTERDLEYIENYPKFKTCEWGFVLNSFGCEIAILVSNSEEKCSIITFGDEVPTPFSNLFRKFHGTYVEYLEEGFVSVNRIIEIIKQFSGTNATKFRGEVNMKKLNLI